MQTILFSALTLALCATSAGAHSTLEQQDAKIGTTTKLTLRVPHGCDGAATNAVTIDLPEGIYAAKPMPKAGWTLEVTTGAYATPFDNHGTEMTEGVQQIRWSGGHLEDAWYDEFIFRASVGPELTPGTILYFPTVQTCADSVADWTDTSGSHSVPNPAPSLLFLAGGDGHMGHGRHGMTADPASGAGEFSVGDLTITAPFSRATLPNAPVAGGFLSIANAGAQDDRLIGVAADVAGRAEIHEMAMDGDVMKMRKLDDGLLVPAGGTVVLKPGGLHLMMMDLTQPLVEGETVAVTLTFETAGEVIVTLPVGAPNARDAGDDHAHHGTHDSGHAGGHNHAPAEK
ncbi:DUF1775 domain-containing protein [Pseudoruegeria sp. SK021]|uniref:DUF1775 domain-containing protein n=1 Tax=Pseudoruegeria sp. SK021 TaxID=1933035 RepID=UPI000A23E8D7|nr:DUF1775 domain-containing protein [Pseudoruegeria sp. SK021]OSP56138.1 hypothetical protein BV911_04165 [Pseudoruegeria sp. SK021]